MKHYNQLAGQKIQRIEAICDGVFAVALTLLVLDVKVPIAAGIRSERDLLIALVGLIPKLSTYFLSFMTLGIFWTGHSVQFQYIEKSDRNLNWISLMYLFFVSTIPFTTAFLNEHIQFKLAIALYWLNIFLLGLILYINWSYAAKHHFLNLDPVEAVVVGRAIKSRIIIAQSLYAAGAILCAINNYLSIVVIICIQLNYAFALVGHHKKKEIPLQHSAHNQN